MYDVKSCHLVKETGLHEHIYMFPTRFLFNLLVKQLTFALLLHCRKLQEAEAVLSTT